VHYTHINIAVNQQQQEPRMRLMWKFSSPKAIESEYIFTYIHYLLLFD